MLLGGKKVVKEREDKVSRLIFLLVLSFFFFFPPQPKSKKSWRAWWPSKSPGIADLVFFHDWEVFPLRWRRVSFTKRWMGKSGCLKHDLRGSISCSTDWGGGSGSLLATHLPTVHWCYVAHRVAGPNMVWVVTGLVDRSCGIGCMSGGGAVLVPTATALATSALWCSFLQVHATPGSSAGAVSTLRLVFRQLLGCRQKRVHRFLCLKVCRGPFYQRLFMFYCARHHHAQNASAWRMRTHHVSGGKNRQLKGESAGFLHSSPLHLNLFIIIKGITDPYIWSFLQHKGKQKWRLKLPSPCHSNAEGCSPIAMKISLTFIAVLAEVSIKSKLLSSAYACASW